MSAAVVELSPAVFGIAITLIGVVVTVAIKIHLSSRDIEKVAELVEGMHTEQTRMSVLVKQHDDQITEWRTLSSDRYVLIVGHDGRLDRLERDLDALSQSIHRFRGEMQQRLGDLQLKWRTRRDGGE